MRHRTLILALTLAVLAVGCSDSDGASEDALAGTTDASPVEPTAGRSPDAETISMTDDRKVILTASIAIEAEDPRASHDLIEDLVATGGGYIQSASISDTEDGQPRVSMVVRVPAADLASTLDSISAAATRVVSQTQRGTDVTEEYVDVEARILNLSILESELQALLADVRTRPDADPAKLLTVFNEINRVRGEIEQAEGRRQVLDNLTSLATVEISVVPAPAVAPVVAGHWQPLTSAREALADLVSALQVVGDVAIRLVVFVLPLAILILVPVFGLVRARQRRSRPQEA